MEGRYPRGLLVEWFGAGAGIENWFAEEYRPRAIATGWVDGGHLYRDTVPDRERVLVIFESDRWDLEDLPEDFDARRTSWRSPFTTSRSGLYRRCGPPSRLSTSGFVSERSGVAPVKSLFVELSTSAIGDASKLFTWWNKGEWGFNDWYNRRYVPALMSETGFDTAYRYANTLLEPDGQRRFLALYESGSPPASSREAIAPYLAHERPLPEGVPAQENARFLESVLLDLVC